MGTKYEGTEREVKTLNAFINLMRAANSVEARLSLKLNKYGLTTSQFGTLNTLYHLGPMCQKDIAGKLLKSGGNITKVIDNLEKKKLVKRERIEGDRRYYSISLTKHGSHFIEKVFADHLKEIVKEFAILTDTELEQLRELSRFVGRQKRD